MRVRGLWGLAMAGAAAFWTVNLLISLTPLASAYRAALSIQYASMLIEAALGGILIGLAVSWSLLRFPDRIPGATPTVKAFVVSVIVLITLTALIDAPGKFTGSLDDPWRYFFIGLAFNALRILALGVVIGAFCSRAPER